jgi:hypothetical protein
MEMKELLKLIENVDHTDSDALDEIDYRVFKFIHGRAVPNRAARYTRSRDALKAIRPDGWFFQAGILGRGYECFAYRLKELDQDFFETTYLPTEELAELHAIIQAIEYERSNKNK